ncbi:MAG: ATP-binding cassette domain-containing protein [Anaerolineales bacterium]|nr:ATP-binding cassette domain-containing protein [Anaerolineales bacterium]
MPRASDDYWQLSSFSIRVDLKDYPRKYLREQIGIVQQEPFLFSRSIRENILYGVGRKVTQEEIEAAAKAAAVHDVIVTFPDGYNTIVGEKGVTLSGGQKQRVTEVARTITESRITWSPATPPRQWTLKLKLPSVKRWIT